MNAPAFGPQRPLGVLVKVFPKLSETFILEEVLGLERMGLSLRLYALDEPTDTISHPAVARVRAPVVTVPALRWCHARSFAARHGALLTRDPVAYAAGLGAALKRGPQGLRDFIRAGWLADQCEHDGVAHLHSHFISEPADIAALVGRLLAQPFSISAHAKDIYLSAERDVRRRLLAARFTVTCTEFNRQTLAHIAPLAQVQRMYHGVDHALFHPRQRVLPDLGRPLILSVGRLRNKKGLDCLIEACAMLHRRGQDFECQIVGYGPEQQALQAQIDHLNLSTKVRLVGKLAREDVIARYAQASIFVQPSRVAADGDRDGIPNVLLEAMAMGLPVVASRVSGIPELVQDGINGLLVEADRPAELADAVERLLQTRRWGAALGCQARATVVEQFDNDRNLHALRQLLQAPVAHSAAATTTAIPTATATATAPTTVTANATANATASALGKGTVAYVMNAFPRLSETFITHEIVQLEAAGQPLRLFAVKREPEPQVHPVVARIRAPLQHLPKASSLSGQTLRRWLAHNLPAFWRDHLALLQRAPLRYLGCLSQALGLTLRHWPRKVFIKEFLQAGALARAVLEAGDVGHLHGHFCHGVATITWWASRLSNIPFSFTAHAKDIYQRELNPGDLLERKLGAARFVATCTCANAGVLRQRHARPDEVHTIYHGLDTRYFAPAHAGREDGAPASATGLGEALTHSTPTPLILAVGRLVEKKGFDQLIEACAVLHAQGLEFHCCIVGESGSAQAALRQQINSLGLQAHVQLRGAVTQDQLREIYRGAGIFALPCQIMEDGDRDGFPNVLAEAMAMGVPVVSTAISGIPEMIDDGVHGLLVPPRDAQALAQALARLISDSALRKRLAQAARARICERFDSSQTTLALHALFQQALRAEGDRQAQHPRLGAAA